MLSRILSIVLVRHGPVALSERQWATPSQMSAWVALYNSAGLNTEAPLPDAVLKMAAESAVLVASPLKRSQQSAQQLAQEQALLVDPLFLEAELPVPNWSSIALPPSTWAAILRAAWYMGFSSTSESKVHAEQRAAKATDLLLQLSQQHGTVMHVGHGIMLSLIGKCLDSRGWKTRSRFAMGYWAMRVYEKGTPRHSAQ